MLAMDGSGNTAMLKLDTSLCCNSLLFIATLLPVQFASICCDTECLRPGYITSTTHLVQVGKRSWLKKPVLLPQTLLEVLPRSP